MIFIFKWEVLCNQILFNQKISLSRKLFVINGSSVVFIENSDIPLVFFTFVLTIATKYRCIQLAILHFRLRWHNLWNKMFLASYFNCISTCNSKNIHQDIFVLFTYLLSVRHARKNYSRHYFCILPCTQLYKILLIFLTWNIPKFCEFI